MAPVMPGISYPLPGRSMPSFQLYLYVLYQLIGLLGSAKNTLMIETAGTYLRRNQDLAASAGRFKVDSTERSKSTHQLVHIARTNSQLLGKMATIDDVSFQSGAGLHCLMQNLTGKMRYISDGSERGI